MIDSDFQQRLRNIVMSVELAENFSVKIGQDEEIPNGRYYFQIAYYRKDVITAEMGMGYGGRAYLSPYASDSELVQTIFGLYKSFWEHEARETFKWKGRRVFGPHISTDALWDAAPHIDIRKKKEA